MSTEATVRGYMLIGPMTYIEGTYSDADRASILNRLPPETRTLIGHMKDVEWYPRKHAVHIFNAIAQHHRDLEGGIRKGLYDTGWNIATRAMETFLKLVMKVMTPEVFARKVPDIWLRDHRGGRLVVDSSDVANNHLIYQLVDVGGYDYVGGILPGFQSGALTAIGCKDVTYETEWSPDSPGPDTVTCHFRWK